MWHSSQTVRDEADGRIVVTLNVSNDFALRSWILSFWRARDGHGAAYPRSEIAAECSRMVERYRE